MFGKKRDMETCHSCDRAVREGQKVCHCGAATHYMNFAERTAWELEQYRNYQQRSATA